MTANVITPCRVVLERVDMEFFQTPQKQLALSTELRKAIQERNQLTCKSKHEIIKALADLEKKSKSERRTMVLQEILSSELAYLKQIEMIQNFFMGPIRTNSFLKPEEFEHLFSSIDVIYQVNGALVEELKADLMNITNAFHKMAPFFKLYSDYAYNFKYSLNKLQSYHEEKPEFSVFVHNQETRPEVQQKLSSLLIAPIQRIPRYALLMKQVLDCTPKNAICYQKLAETYEKLKEVAQHIDDVVEERENAQRMFELMQRIQDGKALVIKAGRRLIKEGKAIKFVKDNSKKNIYLALFSDILMICEYSKWRTRENSLKCINIFPLSKCSVKQQSNMMIFVSCMDNDLTFFTEKGEEEEWRCGINIAIRECLDNQSTLRLGYSGRRPAGKSNLEHYMEHGVSPRALGVRRKRRLTSEFGDKENQRPEKIVKRRKSDGRLGKLKSLLPECRLKRRRHSSAARRTSPRAASASRRNISGNEIRDCLYPLRVQVQPTPVETTSQPAPINAMVPYNFNFSQNIKHNRARERVFTFTGIFKSVTKVFKRVFNQIF